MGWPFWRMPVACSCGAALLDEEVLPANRLLLQCISAVCVTRKEIYNDKLTLRQLLHRGALPHNFGRHALTQRGWQEPTQHIYLYKITLRMRQASQKQSYAKR